VDSSLGRIFHSPECDRYMKQMLNYRRHVLTNINEGHFGMAPVDFRTLPLTIHTDKAAKSPHESGPRYNRK